MSIALIVTRGYGNGTFNGTIRDVVTRGYTIGEVAASLQTSSRYKIDFLSDDREMLFQSDDREMFLQNDDREIVM